MYKIFLYSDPPSYYRVDLPWFMSFLQLRKEGIELVTGNELFTDCNAYLFHYVQSQEVWDSIGQLKDSGKKIILSLDDNLWQVPVWNPWHDGYKDTSKIDWLLGIADHVWVSTEALRGVIGRGTVLPNLLDASDWPTVQRPVNDKVRIVWAGSAFHEPDLEIVGKLYDSLLDRYSSEIVCLFFGSWPESTSEWVRLKGSNYGTMVPAARYQGRLGYLLPVERSRYPEALVNLNPDIGIAALEDSPFARCKSNLKAIEYSMTGAATVATDLEPYQGTSALLGNLDDLCCQLIESRAERERIGRESRETVLRDWTWQGAKKELWLNAFREVAQST